MLPKFVKLLGVKIDNKLNFHEHASSICKRISQKIHALARVSNFMHQDRLRLVMKAFIESQFSYCPLISMFHSRTLNNRINSLHERALRLVYGDNTSSFEELLHSDESFSIHDRKLQKLANEMFKVKHDLSPSFMHSVFPERENHHNLRNGSTFKTENVRTTYYDTATLRYRGPKTWDIVLDDIKKSTSLNQFKRKIKLWKLEGCTCRMCKVFISKVGFIY